MKLSGAAARTGKKKENKKITITKKGSEGLQKFNSTVAIRKERKEISSIRSKSLGQWFCSILEKMLYIKDPKT